MVWNEKWISFPGVAQYYMGIQSRTILSYSVLHRICCTPDTDTSAGVSGTTFHRLHTALHCRLKTLECISPSLFWKAATPCCNAVHFQSWHNMIVTSKSCVNQSPAEGACCQAGRCDSTDHVQSPHSVTMIHRPSAPCAVSGVLCAAPHLRCGSNISGNICDPPRA